MVTLTWLPSALRPLGVADSAVEDNLAMTAKATAPWPLGETGTQFRLGGQLGDAPAGGSERQCCARPQG